MQMRVVKNAGVHILKIAFEQQVKNGDGVSHVWHGDDHRAIVGKLFADISEKSFRVGHVFDDVVTDNKVEMTIWNLGGHFVISSG